MAGFFAALLMVTIVTYGVLIVWGFFEAVRQIGFIKTVFGLFGLMFLIAFAAGAAGGVTGLSDRADGALLFFGETVGVGFAAFIFIARSGGFDLSDSKIKVAGVTQIIGLLTAIIELVKALS